MYRYFFEDGTVVNSRHGKKEYSREMSETLKEKEDTILKYLDNTEQVYHLTADVFLYNSLHKLRNFFRKSVLKGLLNFGKIGAFQTMNEANEKAFEDKRMVQIFTWRQLH
jgi:phytoene dehydrogenase-like protein